MGRQEQPPLAHPPALSLWVLNSSGGWCPANQGQRVLPDAARWADSPQKGKYSAEKPDLEFKVPTKKQTHGGLC